MAEGAVSQIKEIPHVAAKTPLLAIGIGLGFLVLVLIVEAFKPGLLTGPIRHLLVTLGLKGAA
jgi:hypothetical protein